MRLASSRRLLILALFVSVAAVAIIAWPTLYLVIFTKAHTSPDDNGGTVSCRVHRFSGESSGVGLFPKDTSVWIYAGKLEGLYEWRWPDGSLRMVGHWKKGHGDGIWKEYSQKGELIRVWEFRSPGERAILLQRGG